MVQVTDKALDRLEMVRNENSLPEGQGIALVPRSAGELASWPPRRSRMTR